MTIVEAVIKVLIGSNRPMTSKEVYDEIIEQQLYVFGAKDPIHVVDQQIRRSCVGLEFPTSTKVKRFEIVGHKNNKPLYFITRKSKINTNNENSYKPELSELSPDEKISEAYKSHLLLLSQQLHDSIMNNDPAFFEKLVVELLLKMGYGYDEKSGIVTGKSHDGGIDGIINEDKLGLDLIYIQAKRYASSNTVGRREIQAFIGAMENVQKGVFITTSKFTREAKDFVNKQQQKNIKLIDGDLLTELLIKHKVGINVASVIELYKIDNDYFEL